jgi:Arabinose-binding domain of AraC transcription regulator, N-term
LKDFFGHNRQPWMRIALSSVRSGFAAWAGKDLPTETEWEFEFEGYVTSDGAKAGHSKGFHFSNFGLTVITKRLLVSGVSLTDQRAATMIGPGMIRVSAAMPIASVLGDFGISLEPVLSDLGIRPDVFGDFENVIPYATLCRLASRCAALTKRDDFGLLVGQKGGFGSLGRVGFAAQHAPTVGAAIESVAEYFQFHDRSATSALRVNGPLALVTYRVYHPDIDGADQVGDSAVAISFLILQALCGPRWSATEVFFSRRKPASLQACKPASLQACKPQALQGILQESTALRLRQLGGVLPDRMARPPSPSSGTDPTQAAGQRYAAASRQCTRRIS